MSGFAPIRSIAGGDVTLDQLAPGEMYLNKKAADKLHVRAGDPLLVFAGAKPSSDAHQRVVRFDGVGDGRLRASSAAR